MILGLDISTAAVGFTVIDNDGQVKNIDFCSLKKIPNLMDKAARIKSVLFDYTLKYPIENVFIEENLQAFRSGASSAATIAKLARFNGIVSYLIFDIFEIKPVYFNVLKARSTVGLKVRRQKQCGISTKEQVFSWAREKFPDQFWPTKILKSGPRKGQTVYLDECYDMADSLVVSLAGFEHLKNNR